MAAIRKLLEDQSGSSAAEYALILAIIGSVIAIAAISLGDAVGVSMNDSSSCISDSSTC